MIAKQKYINIECIQCTTCCREPIVPITDSDVKRLMKGTGLPAKQFLRFYSQTEMEYSADAPLWIKLTGGRKAMGLKRKNNQCMFLGTDGLCTVYTSRSMTCRTFPYQVDYDYNDTIESVSINPVMKCKCKKLGMMDMDKLLRKNARQERAEDFAYYDKVDYWNDTFKKGKSTEFMEYLGIL